MPSACAISKHVTPASLTPRDGMNRSCVAGLRRCLLASAMWTRAELGELCGSGRDTGPVLVAPGTGAPRGRADTPRHPPMGLMALTGGTVALQ